MMIHLMYDEKIIDKLIDNFEKAAPGKNIFLIFKREESGLPFKYIKSQLDCIRIFDAEKDDINDIIKQHNAKTIICHLLSSDFAEQILKVNQPVRFIWIIWGYDVYSLPKIRPTIYGKLTKQFIFKNNKFQRSDWFIKNNKFLRSIYYLITGKKNTFQLLELAHKKIDYCSSFMKEDFDIFKYHYSDNKAQFLEAAFQTLDQYLGSIDPELIVNGSDILIGNSNTPESNHLDVFEILSDNLQGDSKVYVPLSYGTNDAYKSEVLKKGREKLGAGFEPLLSFMELDRYIEIQQSCSVGIFYHYRQQAMGNIIAMLWMGSRIYMYKNNPAFKYLKRIGMVVFDLDNDYKTFGTRMLDSDEILNNRKILNQLFSKEAISENYKRIVQLSL